MTTSVLPEAESLINGQRRKDYGDVRSNFDTVASLWSVALGVVVSGEDVLRCMILLKVARDMTGETKRDTLVDIAGYAGCMAKYVGVDA